MSDELKPCPHCGVMPEIVGGGVWPMCKCYMEKYEDGPLDINAWNNRPIEGALRARVAALEEQTRWIPVSEHLPEDSDKVLVWMEYPDLFIAPQEDFGYYIKGEWIGDNTDSMVHSKNVTHYMRLPPPPEVQNEN